MKKTIFSSTGLVVVFLMAAIGFSSCSSSDGNSASTGGGAPTVDGKQLKYVKVGSTVTILDYDTEGRVLSLTTNGSKIVYSYSESQVTKTTSSGSSSAKVVTYTLTNGRITQKIEKGASSSNGDLITTYEYDGNGYLISASYSGTESSSESYAKYTYTESKRTTYTWNDGNVETTTSDRIDTYTYTPTSGSASTNSSTSHGVDTYTYSSHTLTLPLFDMGDDSVLAWQGYFGRSCRNLPSKVQSVTQRESSESGSSSKSVSTSTDTTEYVYSFNGNILEKVLVTYTSNSGSVNVETIELSWN